MFFMFDFPLIHNQHWVTCSICYFSVKTDYFDIEKQCGVKNLVSGLVDLMYHNHANIEYLNNVMLFEQGSAIILECRFHNCKLWYMLIPVNVLVCNAYVELLIYCVIVVVSL